MKHDATLKGRRFLRLHGYDYSLPGAYFVTICVAKRLPMFGQIEDGVLMPTPAAAVLSRVWDELPVRFPHVKSGELAIMPNHTHGIIYLGELSDASSRPAALGNIVGAFKSISARRINRILGRSGSPVRQRDYFERIVRDEHELALIRQYIVDNPANWATDEENPNSR